MTNTRVRGKTLHTRNYKLNCAFKYDFKNKSLYSKSSWYTNINTKAISYNTLYLFSAAVVLSFLCCNSIVISGESKFIPLLWHVYYGKKNTFQVLRLFEKMWAAKLEVHHPRSFVRKMHQLIITVGRVAKIIATRKVRTIFVGINFDVVKIGTCAKQLKYFLFSRNIYSLFSPPIFLSLLLNHFIESGNIS